MGRLFGRKPNGARAPSIFNPKRHPNDARRKKDRFLSAFRKQKPKKDPLGVAGKQK